MRPEIEVAPFTADHLDAAAGLLARRQAALRSIRRTTEFRLHRHIDERIAWADGRRG